MVTEYSGIPADGRLAAVEETLTIAPAPRSLHPGKHGLGGAHGAHQVDLPGALPDLLGQLVETVDLGPADVVDEAVDAAERLERRVDHALRLAGRREVGRDVQVAGAFRAAARADDPGAFGLELRDGGEADALGRTR